MCGAWLDGAVGRPPGPGEAPPGAGQEAGQEEAGKMAANSRYGITLKQLRELMEHRGREGVEKVR